MLMSERLGVKTENAGLTRGLSRTLSKAKSSLVGAFKRSKSVDVQASRGYTHRREVEWVISRPTQVQASTQVPQGGFNIPRKPVPTRPHPGLARHHSAFGAISDSHIPLQRRDAVRIKPRPIQFTARLMDDYSDEKPTVSRPAGLGMPLPPLPARLVAHHPPEDERVPSPWPRPLSIQKTPSLTPVRQPSLRRVGNLPERGASVPRRQVSRNGASALVPPAPLNRRKPLSALPAEAPMAHQDHRESVAAPLRPRVLENSEPLPSVAQLAPRQDHLESFSPPRSISPGRLNHNALMHSSAIGAVVSWLQNNLSHIPYAVSGLAALNMWGFHYHLPSRVTVLCPEPCRELITCWAITNDIHLYPDSREFGAQLDGDDGHVRRVRMKYVSEEDFALLRTVDMGGRVLGLPSLVDVLAGEFMDMKGRRTGDKRLMRGSGIQWAVDRMVELGVEVEQGDVPNVGKLLFLEPFECTYPGSKDLFERAGLLGEAEEVDELDL